MEFKCVWKDMEKIKRGDKKYKAIRPKGERG